MDDNDPVTGAPRSDTPESKTYCQSGLPTRKFWLSREIVRLGEARMADILAISLAADQRANVQAYTLACIAAAIAVAAAAYANIGGHDPSAVWALTASAVLFLPATALAFVACAPVIYHTRGYAPSLIVGGANNEMQILMWTADEIQRRIDVNFAANARTANGRCEATGPPWQLS